jgi:hypothetical protein
MLAELTVERGGRSFYIRLLRAGVTRAAGARTH